MTVFKLRPQSWESAELAVGVPNGTTVSRRFMVFSGLNSTEKHRYSSKGGCNTSITNILVKIILVITLESRFQKNDL